MKKKLLLLLFFQLIGILSIKSTSINKKDSLYLRSIMLKAVDFQYTDFDSSLIYSHFLVSESAKYKSMFFKGKAYNQLGSLYRNQGQADSVVKYYKMALQIAKKYNYKALASDVLTNYSIHLLDTGDFDKSIEYQKKSIALDLELGITDFIESSIINLGNVYIEKTDYIQALKLFDMALKLSLKNKKPHFAAGALLNIAKVYGELNEYDKSIKYTHFAYSIFKNENDLRGEFFVLQKLSTFYFFIGDYGKSTRYCLELIENKNKIPDKQIVADAFELLGSIYIKQEKFDDALNCYNEALIFRQQAEQYVHLPNSYVNISNVLISQKKYDYAKIYLDKAIALSDSLKLKDKYIEIYRNYALIDSSKGNFKSAYKNHQLYKAYSDSVFNDENRMALERYKIQSEFEFKDRLNKEQEAFKQKEYEQSITLAQTKLYGTILLFVLITGVLIFYAHQQRKFRKQREKLSLLMVRDAELKALQSQINTHFVYNALNGVCSFIYSNLPDKALLYMNKFANHLRITLENSRKSWVTLASEIDSVKCYVELESLQLDFPPDFEVAVDDSINTESVFIPPMLLQPMIENSFKHAINQNPENAKLLIEIKYINNSVQISVIDNGPELIKSKDVKHKGLSLSSKINYDRLDFINQQYKSNIRFAFYKKQTRIGDSSVAELTLPFVSDAMVA